jgi:uncharacterized protein (TIGR02453 family)
MKNMNTTLEFLTDLKNNNDRDWFQAHREQYERSQNEVKNLFAELGELIRKQDEIDHIGSKVFRIYRDVRFSKDKSPYKTSRSMVFRRAGAERRGGYYLHVEPGNIFLATGFWKPDPQELFHLRKQISQSDEEMRSILNEKTIKEYFGEMQGDKLKRAPKGFDKEDPALDLLRYKGFILTHQFNREEAESPDFAMNVAEGFHKARPFLNYMSEILTTDLNGVPLA